MRITLTLTAIAVLGWYTLDDLHSELRLTALALLSTQDDACLTMLSEMYPHVPRVHMHVEPVDLDVDGTTDYMIELVSESTCGSAGCLFELCHINESGDATYVPFTYAARSIEPLNTIQNGMRDLSVNSTGSEVRLSWDGSSYTLVTE